ncbi:hypothetical protein BC332_27911 [Capsicum chinense]|nr:hypothetical protein BC332_27911 [Capsicum chinense]
MDQYDDFMATLSRVVTYFMHNSKNHQIRIFLWTIGFNPKEETSHAAVWILFPNLSTDLFAKRTFLSIYSAYGKPIVVDKATEVRSRPSTARLLMDTLDSSAWEIPSPSMEAIGEKWDDFGHKLFFKGNEQDVDGVVVLTPTHSNNKTKRHEPGDLLEDPMDEFEGDLGVDIIDEEDEDGVLNECFAKVARDGDLSPRKQRKGFKKKKTHERKHSWDG